MKKNFLLLQFLALVLTSPALLNSAQSKGSGELEHVLRQMEVTGKSFKNIRAKMTQKKYTAVLQEFDAPETGTFVYSRDADGSALLRQEIRHPAVRILTIKGGTATVYQPRQKLAQVWNLGKNKDKAEYLALGLGQSPGKLRETFHLKYLGAEPVGDGLCSMIELRPKSSAAAAYFSSITLWIKKSNGIPIQQKLQEPNGDYLLVNFAEEKLNTKLDNGLFEQKLPGDTEIQKIR